MTIKAKEITITNRDGEEKVFLISRVPATEMREIVAMYPLSAVMSAGAEGYKTNEIVMLKMLAYVGVPRGESEAPLMLTTKALIDNHTGDWEALAKIEIAMFEYNTSFFDKGVASTFFGGIAQNSSKWISSILTGLSEQLLATAKQHSTS